MGISLDSIYSVLGIASFLLFVSTRVQQFINSIVLVLGVSSFCIWCFCWMSCPLHSNFFLINIFLFFIKKILIVSPSGSCVSLTGYVVTCLLDLLDGWVEILFVS